MAYQPPALGKLQQEQGARVRPLRSKYLGTRSKAPNETEPSDGSWSEGSPDDGADDADLPAHLDLEASELDPADVFFRTDIYDAALVAAFGGVRMNLDGDVEMHVHPFLLFVFCLPLVCAQFALTFCVGLHMDLDAPVHNAQEDEALEVTIKVLLIAIIQITFFDRLLGTLRLLIFTLNPASWTDIVRIDPHSRERLGSSCFWIHYVPVVAAPAFGSLFLKLLTQYYVNVQSVSIILASPNLEESIFDSLAISFITELDSVMWQFAKTILHLDDFDQFVFRLWPPDVRKRCNQESWFRGLLVRFRFLHRGMGARRMENFMAFFLLYLLNMRMLITILFAINTNVVPAARDVCIQWRWLRGGGKRHPWLASLYRFLVYCLLSPFRNFWDPADEVARKAHEFCSNEHRDASQDHMGEMILEYPGATTIVCVILALLLIVPELFLEKGRLRRKLMSLDAMVDVPGAAGENKDVPAASATCNSKRIAVLRKEFDSEKREMREQVQQLLRRLTEAERKLEQAGLR